MTRYLRARGVPDTALVLDPGGERTYDSCRRAVDVYGIRSAIVMSRMPMEPGPSSSCIRDLMRKLAAVLIALSVGCTAAQPAADLARSGAPSLPASSPAPAADPCPIASLSDRATAPPLPAGPTATGAVSGTLLFQDAGRFAVFSGGSLVDITPPFSPHDRLGRLSPDGQELRAILRDGAGQATYLWRHGLASRTGSLVTLSTPLLPFHARFEWSPDVTRYIHVPDFDAVEMEILTGGLDGTVDRARVPGERLVSWAWRGGNELTFATAPGTFEFPKPDATLWSWRPGGASERLGRIGLGSSSMEWARRGDALAYIGLDEQGKTALRIRTAGQDAVVMRLTDLLRTPFGCRIGGGAMRFSSVEWSPGGASVLVRGQGPGQSLYFAAWLRGSGDPGFFLVPPSCYTFRSIWASSARILVPMWGPDCGVDERTNRLGMVDAQTARVQAELPIGRKALVLPSPDGRWAASSDEQLVHVFLLDDPSVRFTIPRAGLIEWCCRTD